MTKKMIREIILELDRLYPDAKAELEYSSPFELLIAVILSAQCTDVRVNQVTRILFEKANTPEQLLTLSLTELENIIKPCGIYKNKAHNIYETSQMIVHNFHGNVPGTIEMLMTLPGVGKKTANVVVSNAFDTPAIAVDTHVFRVSNRIGLANAQTVEETEKQLMQGIDRDRWTKAHHMIIFHGRRVCKARNPNCTECTLQPYCKYYKTTNRSKVNEQ